MKHRKSHQSESRHDPAGLADLALAQAAPAGHEEIAFLPEPADQRLHRLAQWCRTGQLAAAELELHDWQRHDDCPPVARVLLAGILARRNAIDLALHVLRRGGHAADDLAVGQLLLTLLLGQELQESARKVTQTLHHRHGQDQTVKAWLCAVEAPGARELPLVPEAAIEQLAVELVAKPQLIPTLVAAQKRRSDPADLVLLRRALNIAARELTRDSQMLMVCQAMAELALLAGDRDDARRWAHRGIRIEPMSAPLALVLAEVEDDPAMGPPAAEILEQALSAHPTYADVHAALIRRQKTTGDADTARLKLAQWLEQEPNHPVANQLRQELAA